MQTAGPRCIVVTLIVMALAFPLLARGQESSTEDGEAKTVERLTGDELTLKRLFPEKSPWGPRASGMSFSHEGRWGAYLYRPHIERRHGSDLWLYDTESGETRRVTMVSVMSEFQSSARKVGEDRSEKAKKRKKGKQGAKDEASSDDEGGAITEDHLLGTWKGRLRGDEDPDGLAVTIVIKRRDDGALGGTLSTFFIRDTLAEITFDDASSTLRAALVRRGTGEVGRLEAKIEDGAMRGSVAMASMKTTLEIDAKRTGEEGDEDGEGEGGEDEDGDGDVVDRVDEKDADDEKAPRYSGVGSYVWSPTADELIFASEGDLYRYAVDGGSIDRLTRTQESERGVRYLPDGTGYTYMRGNSIIRVRWEDHLLYQLDPKLPNGHSLGSFELSKDGEKLAIVSQKGQSRGSGGTTVNIISYRSRFAQVRQVPRHMSDNKFPDLETNVYLYERNGAFAEEDKLTTVHTHKHTGPRDILRTPQWALDSSRFAFTVFDQESGHMEMYEVVVPVEEEEEDEEGDEDADEEVDEEVDEEGDEDEGEGEEADKDEDEEETKAEARLVYRFFHHGGPNTPSMMVPLYLADSRRIAMITEQSGYRQLHVLDPLYEAMDQVTRGSFELYPIEASPDHRLLFATASKDDPAQEHVYRIDLEDYSMTRLTTEEGVYSRAAVSPDGMRVLANHADFASPTMLVAVNVESGETRPLVEPQPEEVQRLTAAIPTYFTYENRHGHTIHGHMFLPPGYTPEDERPLLVYVYGGPLGTRNMTGRGSFSSASYLFAYYMAEKHGYVTCTIDPRGVSGYGGLFEKSNFEKIGKPQTEDLVDGVEWFVDNHGVDAKRAGIHGWSFGGFQTQMCLYTEPDVFACGIAGAGPTEWENYNSWYSTGTVGESREGKTDLEKYSLLPLAKNLKAKLLLVHGMEDSNVLYQDTVKVYRELLKANKETLVELFLDPTGGHGLGGDVKTIGRYRKYEEFLTRVLGSEKVEAEEEE